MTKPSPSLMVYALPAVPLAFLGLPLYAGLPVLIKLLAVLALQRSQLMRSSALDAEPTGEDIDVCQTMACADRLGGVSGRL